MDVTTCPQCKNVLKGASVRLVQDACGHKKCRMCLLHDEEKCEQCTNKKESPAETVIKYEHNHTAVITCSSNKSNVIANETEPLKKCDESSKLPNINSTKCNNANNDKEKRTRNKKTDVTYKTEELSLKRTYNTLVVPNHITVLKDPVNYLCTVCNRTFSTKSHIKYHLYCNGSKPYRCNECAKEFVLKSHLELHMVSHAGLKPHSCSICKKSFTLKSKLNRHRLLHSSNRPCVCQECGKTFKTKESLRVHLLIHRGEKPFACKYCYAKFNNSSNLNKHLVGKHSDAKMHMCDQCGKQFKLKWALTVHRRTHLLIRPYICPTCSRSFINAKDLNRHQLIHIDIKAYSCGLCKTGFRRKDNLKRHIRNSHPGKEVMPIKNPIKPVFPKLKTHLPVDNPNAINVITASPSSVLNKISPSAKTETRSVPVINGPLKLAFKTTAFKSNYNIHRDYVPPKVFSKQYDMTESVNICQRILSPHSPPPVRNVIQTQNKANGKPLNYETSFEHKTHGVIKNIKFKLPPEYTNLTSKNTEFLNDIKPLKPVSNVNINASDLKNPNNTYHDLKNASNNSATAATSVIVNTNNTNQSEMHWRRRTLQNLNLQSKG